MLQQSLKLWKCLYLVDVGEDIIRPRAIDNRPYEFYRRFCVFCNMPIFQYKYSTIAIYCKKLPAITKM